MAQDTPESGSCCDMSPPSYEGVDIVELSPQPPPADYLQAMAIANGIADDKLGGTCCCHGTIATVTSNRRIIPANAMPSARYRAMSITACTTAPR